MATQNQTMKMAPIELFAEITRIDDEKRVVEGYAFVNEAVPSSDVTILRSAMEDATPDYMKWANLRRMHQQFASGNVLDVNWDKTGAYIRAEVVDNDDWEKVKRGVYKGFSVGVLPKIRRGNTLEKVAWVETSLVDRPKDPQATISLCRSEEFPSQFIIDECEVVLLEERAAKPKKMDDDDDDDDDDDAPPADDASPAVDTVPGSDAPPADDDTPPADADDTPADDTPPATDAPPADDTPADSEPPPADDTSPAPGEDTPPPVDDDVVDADEGPSSEDEDEDDDDDKKKQRAETPAPQTAEQEELAAIQRYQAAMKDFTSATQDISIAEGSKLEAVVNKLHGEVARGFLESLRVSDPDQTAEIVNFIIDRGISTDTVAFPVRENLEGACQHYDCGSDYCCGHKSKEAADECRENNAKGLDSQIESLQSRLGKLRAQRGELGDGLGAESRLDFADPGFQPDNKERWPLTKDGQYSESRIESAWGFVRMPENKARYSDSQINSIELRILKAAGSIGLTLNDHPEAVQEVQRLESLEAENSDLLARAETAERELKLKENTVQSMQAELSSAQAEVVRLEAAVEQVHAEVERLEKLPVKLNQPPQRFTGIERTFAYNAGEINRNELVKRAVETAKEQYDTLYKEIQNEKDAGVRQQRLPELMNLKTQLANLGQPV